MSFWNQFNWTTKAILILLAGMVFVVSVLALIRVDVFPEGLSKTKDESAVLVVPAPDPHWFCGLLRLIFSVVQVLIMKSSGS